ncbi:MAG: hypothetical protein GWN37_16565 [Gammaproteobacteria bacterium]|nr:hypothetical protein [Gammaproteobacteria bacterium]
MSSGYPLNRPVLISNSGIVASSWDFDVAETPIPNAPPGFSMPDVGDVYLADIEVNPRNSGGPVYLVDDASTIGVCVATQQAPVMDERGEHWKIEGRSLTYSSGLTVVVPSRYVTQLLEEGYKAEAG